ncbi:hypothetical protein GCM10009133_17130 [Cocleimonas flava]|uniref:DUF262 domain-containing protein n=1 Tax=Cocleimonas flava TaxID=634765 RepID=A0A4R1EXP6_9GAMM|nr:hypothetical protein [Cocleimonas flava]TCJ84639.1 hypothetical protein EV695_2598 [Cocleimonas flava]
MNFEILDRKEENNSTCLLIKASLKDYISTLPSDYDNYDVQRSIVNNSYLDRLVNTILKKGHIPSITLISDKDVNELQNEIVDDFKILDGLQRTHRMKLIYETKELFLRDIKDAYEQLTDFQFKRKFRDQLLEIGSSSNILIEIKKFFEEHGENELNDCFDANYQWFELWSGLSPEDEVRKMLVLNAGHKPVNIKHQLELLFQNILPIMEDVKSGSISIKREKEVSSITFSKQRELGTYHFSHLISALISFLDKKPVTTNTQFIAKMQEDEKKLYELMSYFSYELIEKFIKSVYAIDVAAKREFQDLGTQWVGREVSLVSLFGAIGQQISDVNQIDECIGRLADNFEKCNLLEYEECRNSVDLAKVNIGNINKKNIYNAFIKFSESGFTETINWRDIFSGGDL